MFRSAIIADIFWCNFGKYGIIGQNLFIPISSGVTASLPLMLGEWTSASALGNTNTTLQAYLASARFGTGIAMVLTVAGGGSQGYGFISYTLPSSIARIIGGIAVTPYLISQTQFGVLFCDGIGTPQIGIGFNVNGQVVVYSGGNTDNSPTTVLATSSASVSSGTSHWLEWDITINNSTGAYTVNLDGVTILSASSVDTRGGSTNNSVSVVQLWAGASTSVPSNSLIGIFGESMYLFNSSGGVNNAIFGIGEVELKLPVSDSSVDFSIQAGVVGYYWSGSTSTTNAPGANKIALVPITPAVACTINSIGILPEATSSGANYKGVIYSNSSGSPNSLLSSGTQVTGATTGVSLTLPLATPQSLSSGTQYWIGFITDTSVVLNLSYANNDPLKGEVGTNTYSSGAPATAPTMTTGQVTWQIWGNTTGQSHNYSEVNSIPAPASLSYVSDGTVTQIDQYNFQALSNTPVTIAGVKVSAFLQLTQAGPRTMNLEITSNLVTSGGSNTGFTPPTTWAWQSSYFDTDPNTSAAWTAAGVNAATAGPLIES